MNKAGESISYRSAGVDIEAADRLVEGIKGVADKTKIPGVLAGVGGFGAMFALKEALPEGFEDPVLVSGTDGVGTKLKVAFAAGRHDTIGQDLVAMCVNDILCCGAKPLFFLDYFATGRLEPKTASKVLEGIAEGCLRAGCALVGGETAELPGMYTDGEYDLAGFAVGVVERSRIVDGSQVRPGQAVVGLLSSGLHSNGFSLARKVLLERGGLGLDDKLSDASELSIGETLLTPTTIYARAVQSILSASAPSAMAHITGGGIAQNLARVLPDDVTAVLVPSRWPTPEIFEAIATMGPVEAEEMERTFNLGLGFLCVVDDAQAAIEAAMGAGVRAVEVGRIEASNGPKVVLR